MANLVSVGQVGLAYNNDIEQILVMLPQIVAIEQGALVAMPTPSRTTRASI